MRNIASCARDHNLHNAKVSKCLPVVVSLFKVIKLIVFLLHCNFVGLMK